MIKLFSLTLLILSLCQTHFAQTPANAELIKIRTDLQTRIEKKELASVSLGVLRKDEVIWKESLGFADHERRIRATTRTIYPLASLSKSITATAVWMLAERGNLSVEDPVRKHLRSARLKYYQAEPEDLKIIHLLNMEGGIPHQYEYFYERDQPKIPPLTEQIGRYGFVAFPPGRVHNYSNFSYAVLDQIIADAAGKSFERFMREKVFRPLEMNRTFASKPAKIPVAKGYDAEGKRIAAHIFEPRGGAGMYSTVEDLLKYGLGHLGKRKNFLKKATLARAHRPNPDSPHPFYAGGWGVLPTADGRTSLLSNGAIAGAATTLLLIPEEEMVIICLTNTTAGNDFTDSLAFRIAGTLLENYSESLQKLFREVGPAFASKPFAADESYTGIWNGRITTDAGDLPFSLTFEPDGKILAAYGNQEKTIVKNPYLEKGLLYGTFDVAAPTGEAGRKPPQQITLTLLKEDEKLYGAATAKLISKAPKFFRPFYVELSRQKP